MYLHRGGLTNQAVIEGRQYHKKWEDEINKNKKVKIGNTEFKFNNPKCEFKFYVPYNEIADLSLVLDCLDTPNLHEWKTGGETSTSYASGYQIPIYFLGCELAEIDVKIAYLLRYNQKEDKEDTTIIHNGALTRERARNYIDSLIYPLYEFLKNENAL